MQRMATNSSPPLCSHGVSLRLDQIILHLTVSCGPTLEILQVLSSIGPHWDFLIMQLMRHVTQWVERSPNSRLPTLGSMVRFSFPRKLHVKVSLDREDFVEFQPHGWPTFYTASLLASILQPLAHRFVDAAKSTYCSNQTRSQCESLGFPQPVCVTVSAVITHQWQHILVQ